MMTKVYEGTVVNGEWSVTVDGQPLPLCLEVVNHSPTGFAWGYAGSGPAQLALALLWDAVGRAWAMPLYQTFKHEVVSGWAEDHGWRLTRDDIVAWVAAKNRP